MPRLRRFVGLQPLVSKTTKEINCGMSETPIVLGFYRYGLNHMGFQIHNLRG